MLFLSHARWEFQQSATRRARADASLGQGARRRVSWLAHDPDSARAQEPPLRVDHHHLALALQEEGVEHVLVSTIADLGHSEKEAFWFVMAHKNWMHAYDGEGRACPWKDIPKRLGDLIDDPFRSLAGELRQFVGYAKDTTLYSEFLWADYLRRHVKLFRLQADFEGAIREALDLARKEQAQYLPGWCSRQ